MANSGAEAAENGEGSRFGLGDMPENCTAQILALTTPKDVCRLTAVSQLFNSAANSEAVWEAMLPHNYRNILSRALNPIAFASKKELYFRLCDSILIDAGTKRVWLERSTGKICYMLSARALTIVWGDDPRYWRWVSRDDSRFEQLAESVQVCWLEARGGIDCRELSANTVYSVSFVLKFGEDFDARRWGAAPVNFSVTTQRGDCQRSGRFLVAGGAGVGARSFRVRTLVEEGGRERLVEAEEYATTTVQNENNGWTKFVAGEFRVGGGGDEGGCVEFCMEEIDGGRWKWGLLVDGVKIEPKQS